MNRIAVSIVLAVSCLLLACGNKGDLFLETDPAIAEEIKLLDESLDELEEESATGSETDSVTEPPVDGNTEAKTEAEIEAAIKKAKKKADSILQTDE